MLYLVTFAFLTDFVKLVYASSSFALLPKARFAPAPI